MSDQKLLADLKALAGRYQSEGLGHVTFSDDKADMKKSCDSIREMLKLWRAISKQVTEGLAGQLNIIASRCDHEGAASGYNERDGYWMSACPICGETE